MMENYELRIMNYEWNLEFRNSNSQFEFVIPFVILNS
jgi:hypothetical protein